MRFKVADDREIKYYGFAKDLRYKQSNVQGRKPSSKENTSKEQIRISGTLS